MNKELENIICESDYFNSLNEVIKLLKLVNKIGNGYGYINKGIRISNLLNLVKGNLSHIGDAIIEGHEITYHKEKVDGYFNGYSGGYKIVPKKKFVFCVEITPFTEEDLVKHELIGNGFIKVYSGYSVILTQNGYKADNVKSYIDKESIRVNKTLFKLENDAIMVAKAMNKLSGI